MLIILVVEEHIVTSQRVTLRYFNELISVPIEKAQSVRYLQLCEQDTCGREICFFRSGKETDRSVAHLKNGTDNTD